MGEDRVILVTGVAGYWGLRVAQELIVAGNGRVIGVDAEPPAAGGTGIDFVPADVRNPALVDFLQAEGVDTVCHLAFVETSRPSSRAFDANVVGTSRLLEVCAQAGVRKVVLKSSTGVYGARPSNSAFLRESQSLRGSRRQGTIRDLIEIERFCDGFRRQAPGMMLTILRFAAILGPTVDTPWVRFLRQPRAPTLLGFDPVMQVVHEDDVVAALVHALHNDVPGVFNVAAEDAMPLSKIRGLAGKPAFPVFHPLVYWGAKRSAGNPSLAGRYLPMDPDYLRYPWVADLARMRDEMQFAPAYTAEETLVEFARLYREGNVRTSAELQALQEHRLRATIEKRQRAQDRQAGASTGAGKEKDDE